MAEKNRVSGRTALVTGGAKGIGGEITRILADKGYTVVIAYNTSGEAAGRIITRLQSEGRNCGAFRADLSCPSQAEELYEWCRKCYGFVDTLINNAGICRFALATDDTPEDYRRVIDTNFGSVFNLTRLFARDMVSRGEGSILNVSSVWGARGAAMETLYSASKAAVIGYTKGLAKELRPSGVRVNCILPGYVLTDMNARFDQRQRAEILRRMGQKRALTAQQAAVAAVELCESGITGKIKRVME